MQLPLGAIFDLDGVIVDTAKYHYLAWKRLAAELGFVFTQENNERLKGVSRTQSLEILLETGNISATEAEKERLATRKNQWYVESLQTLDQSELLPGAFEYLTFLKSKGVKTALGSASKNASIILDKLDIAPLFDAILDGNCVTKTKPDPEIFIKCVNAIGIPPEQCIVYEDSQAGIEAAKAAGCGTVGIGNPAVLLGADHYVDCLAQLL